MRSLLSTLLLTCAAIGCNDYNTPDVHREVFRTPEQTIAEHRSQNQKAWKSLAMSMTQSDRPDVAVKAPDSAFSVVLAADGIEQTVDLTSLEDDLMHHSDREQAILRGKMTEALRTFDAVRFRAIGFEKARGRIFPQFVTGKQLATMQAAFAAGSPIRSTDVVINLAWVPVIRAENGDMLLPIDEGLIRAWKTTPAMVDSAAIENLRARLKAVSPPIETVSFGALGKSGTLKSGLGSEVILLAEFLDQVRAEWKSQDDLVLFVPTRSGVMIAERHNVKLLDQLAPEWKKLAAAADPLCDQLLLRTSEGLSLFGYKPTSKPTAATKPATTKPEIYIVR